jgi:hypothetical protein
MIQTLEAVVDESGMVTLCQPVHFDRPQKAIVMLVPDEPSGLAGECALLSEDALEEDWNCAEEDIAWKHLQPAR